MADDADRIEAEDIAAPDAFDPAIVGATKLLDLLNQIESTVKGNAKSLNASIQTNPANDTASLSKLNTDIKALAATEKAHLIVREEARKQRQQIIREIKGEANAYEDLKNRQLAAQNLANKLGAEYGLTSKQFREAAASANTLNNELKAINAASGNYQRNIGNYNNELGVLARSVRGFGGLSRIIAGALGVDPEIAIGIQEAGRALRDYNHIRGEEKLVEGAATAATEANTVATEENIAAKETQTVATEAVTVATTEASAAFTIFDGLLIASGIGIAIIGLIALAEAFKESAYEASRLRLEQEATKYFNESEKFYGEERVIAIEKEIALQKEKFAATNAATQAQTKLLSNEKSQLESNYNLDSKLLNTKIANAKDAADNEKDEDGSLFIAYQNLKKEREVLDANYHTQSVENTRKYNDLIKKLNFDLWDATIKGIENAFEMETTLIHLNLAKQLELYKGDTEQEIAIRKKLKENAAKEIADATAKYEATQLDISAKTALSQALKNSLAEHNAKQKEYETAKQLELTNVKLTEQEKLAIIEKYRKLEDDEDNRFFDYQKQRTIDADKAKVINLELSGALGNKIRKTQIEEIKAEEAKALAEVGISEEKKALIIAEANKKIHDINAAYEIEQIDSIKRIDDAFFQSLNARNDASQKANEQLLSLDNARIQQQTILFSRGLDNNLAAAEKARAKDLDNQARLNKQKQRQEQAQQLVNIFLEFMKVNASKGPAAAAISLAETLAAKGIAQGLSGSFADGVENFKGKGTGTSDSNVIGFSHGESVVTAKGTSETAGLVSAINEAGFLGAQDWMLKNIPLAPMVIEKSKKGNLNDAQNKLLLAELKDLKQVMKDKRENTWVYDADGKLVGWITKESGLRQMVKTNNAPINYRTKNKPN